MYKVEKGSPDEILIEGRGRPNKFPFPDMQIGDFISSEKSLSNASTSWGRINNRKFSTRKQSDGTYRTYRVA